MASEVRIGEAAAALGVRVETLRRWERARKLKVSRTKGGQRVIPAPELARLLAERSGKRSAVAAQSARNRFEGIVTRVRKHGLVATVEIVSGANRILALTTREAVEEMGLEAGMKAIASVKATNVVVELPL